ncbi:uncharacterized protein LOC124154910 [Ischnura elegans]|uniref:uncharacterized protein LOC124154910 n=1 Tax=Ischnura elegans TaxID=197161 RepID=UPI001ED8AF51|nr:uncharacterized protein LOC124154910 [Ischnura elegans]
MAIGSYDKKPKLWLRYVDDTFVIWPHGPEELQSFLKHINSQHPAIQFTMEMEKDRRIPFLDVMVNKRIDGSLGYEIHRKPTHTDRYLNAFSHHHTSQKASLVATLLHRAYKLSDGESLAKEKEHLMTTLKRNGYNRQMILKRTTQVEKRNRTLDKEKQPNEKPERYATIPYVAGTSEKIFRILKKKNIVTRFKCVIKINQIIPKPKDKIPNNLNEGVYRIPCSCGKAYIGETCRSMKIQNLLEATQPTVLQPKVLMNQSFSLVVDFYAQIMRSAVSSIVNRRVKFLSFLLMLPTNFIALRL